MYIVVVENGGIGGQVEELWNLVEFSEDIAEPVEKICLVVVFRRRGVGGGGRFRRI